jgi:hypothetical protein
LIDTVANGTKSDLPNSFATGMTQMVSQAAGASSQKSRVYANRVGWVETLVSERAVLKGSVTSAYKLARQVEDTANLKTPSGKVTLLESQGKMRSGNGPWRSANSSSHKANLASHGSPPQNLPAQKVK